MLLFCAVGVLWLIRLSPWSQPWLRAKLVGLAIYIAPGVLALRPTRAGGDLSPSKPVETLVCI